MLIKEFRVVLPMTAAEYQVAQLYAVAEASKLETGGGDGVEVLVNAPFDSAKHQPPRPLLDGSYTTGQFTHKCYHIASKVPAFVRALTPSSSMVFTELAWNAYPYCRTVITNGYMKQNFELKIESLHVDNNIALENAHQLPPDLLAKREVIYIDISSNTEIKACDYKAEEDPTRFTSSKTGRGPLQEGKWWEKSHTCPVMCAYKLVTCEFKWFGLQSKVESMIQRQEQRLFTHFHRQTFCWTDGWFGLTMADIRKIEDNVRAELDEKRQKGTVCGRKTDE